MDAAVSREPAALVVRFGGGLASGDEWKKPSEHPSRPPGRRVSTGPVQRPRVLIVDDHEETREMYAWCMRAAGWYVDEAATGEEALAVAGRLRPDVVVMDLRLPALDGLEAARLLRQDPAMRDAAIVACTGRDVAESASLAKDAGCDAFVAKPCTPEKLRALLEDLLAGPGATH